MSLVNVYMWCSFSSKAVYNLKQNMKLDQTGPIFRILLVLRVWTFQFAYRNYYHAFLWMCCSLLWSGSSIHSYSSSVGSQGCWSLSQHLSGHGRRKHWMDDQSIIGETLTLILQFTYENLHTDRPSVSFATWSPDNPPLHDLGHAPSNSF